MFFYEYTAFESKTSENVDASALSHGVSQFNSNQYSRTRAYISSLNDFLEDWEITIGVAVDPTDTSKPKDVAYALLRSLEKPFCDVSDMNGEEISTKEFVKLLKLAKENNYIKDVDSELTDLGLDSFVMHGRTFLKESICDSRMKLSAARKAVRNFCLGNDMAQEIERIYSTASPRRFLGIPVHYIIMSDNDNMVRHSVEILVSALKSRNRIRFGRYVKVDRRTLERDDNSLFSSSSMVPAMFEHQISGAIVLDICGSKYERAEIRENDLDVDSLLCKMKAHRSDVLTISVIGRNDSELLSRLVDGLGCMRFVIIRETAFMGDDAKACLKNLAAQKRVPYDDSLLSAIKPERSYTISELDHIVFEWYDRTMAEKLFPQYKGVAKGCAANVRPKGSAYSQLENLIGLENAKKTIKGVLDYSRLRKVCSAKGLASGSVSGHMVFTGNPGTAKTTVARLFAQIMKDNGILSVGDLVEVGRKDLVGKYVGWTAKLVQEAFERARGSVLFIDEAYSLCDGKDGLYGDEAINTIVQLMENQRDDTIVIFAGYTEQMDEFLDRNPGLRSRISFHVDFDDYSDAELVRILKLIASENGVSLSEGVSERVMEILSQVDHDKAFGNGRYMRNLFEHAKMHMASRLSAVAVDEMSREMVTTLLPEDFELIGSVRCTEAKPIGFAC